MIDQPFFWRSQSEVIGQLIFYFLFFYFFLSYREDFFFRDIEIFYTGGVLEFIVFIYLDRDQLRVHVTEHVTVSDLQ